MTTYKNLSTGVIISEVIYNKLPYNKRHKYSRTYRPEPISSYTLIIEDIDDNSIFINIDDVNSTDNQFGGFGGGDFGGSGAGGSYDDSSCDCGSND